MVNFIRPYRDRDRKDIPALVPPNYSDYLKPITGPRIIFQYNDSKEKCIGLPVILKPENDNLESLSFVPRVPMDSKELYVPDNSTTISIYGQQGIFTSKEEMNNYYDEGVILEELYKINPSLINDEAEIEYIYNKKKIPLNFFISQFYLKNGERNSNCYVKDIVESIEFFDGHFKRLIISEPINLIKYTR